jgi:hypothetical protein
MSAADVPLANSEIGRTTALKEEFMQTLAFLWFELQIAQYRLRETFTESPAHSKALHPNALPRRPNHNPVVWLALLSTRLRKRTASRSI